MVSIYIPFNMRVDCDAVKIGSFRWSGKLSNQSKKILTCWGSKSKRSSDRKKTYYFINLHFDKFILNMWGCLTLWTTCIQQSYLETRFRCGNWKRVESIWIQSDTRRKFHEAIISFKFSKPIHPSIWTTFDTRLKRIFFLLSQASERWIIQALRLTWRCV